MKKIMIILAVLGFTWYGAQAQNKCVCPAAKTHKVAHAALHHTNMLATTRTYQVCREQGGYYVCCMHKETTLTPMTERPLAVDDILGLKRD